MATRDKAENHSTTSATRRRFGNKTQGYSLLEILVVVCIIAILSSIAFPSYQASVRKGRRTDAKSALTDAAALQEKWYFQYNQYTGDEANLAGSNSPEGYYTVDVQQPCGSANCFLMVATASGVQTDDKDCFKLTLDHTGTRRSYDSSNTETTGSADCW